MLQFIQMGTSQNNITHDEVKSRSVKGVVALISRTFIIQIISLFATIALTVLLEPSIYGVFYLVSAVVNFLAYFSDIGLAAALIQKKEEVTDDDLHTTFTIQQILVLSLLTLLFLATPFIKSFFGISSAGIYLMWAFGISLFLSSLKTIPSVLLERHIQFNKLIIPQIAETLVFNIVAVYCAWKGWGINAFTAAVLLRGLVGLFAMYLVSPWKPSLGIHKSSLSHLLRFGLPYQANSFLAMIKDDGMTILLGKLIGPSGLGYLGWASRWANLPLRLFMDNVTKVAFPAFARLQHDKEALKNAVEQSIKYLTLIIFPVLVAMGFVAGPLVGLIPRYSKWLPALIPLYLYLVNSAWATISTLLTNLLSATGRIKVTFKLMIMWTVLTWAIMPFSAIKYGFTGVAFSVGLIAFSSAIVVVVARRSVQFSLGKALSTPILSSFILSAFLFITKGFMTGYSSLIIVCLASVVVYFASVIIFEGRSFITKTSSYFHLSHA